MMLTLPPGGFSAYLVPLDLQAELLLRQSGSIVLLNRARNDQDEL